MVYDRYGNRTAENITAGQGMPSNCVSVDPTTNRLNGICSGGNPFAYDASGNMTNDAANSLTWDAENRMTSSVNGSSSGSYVVDGHNHRVQKTSVVSGTTTSTVYLFSGSQVDVTGLN